MIIFTNPDGSTKDMSSYEFEIFVTGTKKEIGRITVGQISDGDCMTRDHYGIHFRFKDGTKYFVSWSWFTSEDLLN